jgi:succinylglutamate desuccinylase
MLTYKKNNLVFLVYLFSSRKKKRYIQSNQNRGIEGKPKMKNEDHLFVVEMTTEWAMHAAQFFKPFLLF